MTVKVGVIDSGVSDYFYKYSDVTLLSCAVYNINHKKGALESEYYDASEIVRWKHGGMPVSFVDESGHGTSVLSILMSQAEVHISFSVAKILNSSASGSSISMLRAMDWLINDERVDYLNMSLGSLNWSIRSHMAELVKDACRLNCTIYSAAGGYPSLPSELPGVISVGSMSLLRGLKRPVKIDVVEEFEKIKAFWSGNWVDINVDTSFACPVALARRINQDVRK